MILDTHSRVAAILHMVLASLGLLALLVLGALVGAFGAYGASMGVERELAARVGGIGMIVVGVLAAVAILEIVGAALLLRGNDSGRIITLVFSVLHRVNVPIGTAVGAYSMWALLRERRASAAVPGQPSMGTGPAQSV